MSHDQEEAFVMYWGFANMYIRRAIERIGQVQRCI